jgi:hypothetical protein
VRLDGTAKLDVRRSARIDGRALAGDQRRHRFCHDLGEQFLLGGDVLVQARAADAEGRADVHHGRQLVATLGEQPQRRFPNGLPGSRQPAHHTVRREAARNPGRISHA